MTANAAEFLVGGLFVAAVGYAFSFNTRGAADQAAAFIAKPSRPGAWRRFKQDEPRFWKAFGVLWLVWGLLFMGTGVLILVGR